MLKTSQVITDQHYNWLILMTYCDRKYLFDQRSLPVSLLLHNTHSQIVNTHNKYKAKIKKFLQMYSSDIHMLNSMQHSLSGQQFQQVYDIKIFLKKFIETKLFLLWLNTLFTWNDINLYKEKFLSKYWKPLH